MRNRTILGASLLLLTLGFAACSIKDTVPDFEYPETPKDKKWPVLTPTADLEKAADYNIDDIQEEVEKLQKQAL